MQKPLREIDLDIQGLGIILYSPSAASHIPEGADYLREHFSEPQDVARHAMDCRLTTFCTGSPGRFRLEFVLGEPEEAEVQAAEFKLRLGLEVMDGTVCVRDEYDLMEWSAECPESPKLQVADGFYRLTVCSSPPASGILGDHQAITVFMEPVAAKPVLKWEGVPSLC